MSLRRGRARAELNAEINVVSLIDVMMLLLVIFMITAPIMHGGIEVQLPEADAAQIDPNNSGISVTVARSGKIYIDQNAYTLSEFRSAFKAIAGTRAKEGVNVGAEGSVSIQELMNVVSIMTVAGATKLNLLTVPVEGRR